MALRIKTVRGGEYYYLDLSYFVINKSKTFSKYVGAKKPLEKNIAKIEDGFKSEIISKLSGKRYDVKLISKDHVIKSLLFRGAFNNVFSSLTKYQKRRYENDSTILFTLTTLTTEGVDVGLMDVRNAFEKTRKMNTAERISKNMLKAVESIKESHTVDKKYLLNLHRTIMSGFEDKTPGRLRGKRVYLRMQDAMNPHGKEIAYRPPD
jgi:hypothetical protein